MIWWNSNLLELECLDEETEMISVLCFVLFFPQENERRSV